MSKSEKFEQQIERIHDLIEKQDAVVKWDDRVPDPDNPEQPRQIDVTIRRDNSLTLIECRIHKKRQDVQWIEELMGRRTSLRADAVIAVSASGFTKGAARKAKGYGILLRTLRSLTEEEITRWGRKTKIALIFYEYTNVALDFVFDPQFSDRITVDHIDAHLQGKAALYPIFDVIADMIEKENPGVKKPCDISTIVDVVEEFRIGEYPLRQIQVSAHVRRVGQEVDIPSVYLYDSPGADLESDSVLVEDVDLGDFEIAHSSNNVSLAVDLSSVNAPDNCQFRFFETDFGREVRCEAFTLLGMYPMRMGLRNFQIGVRFLQNK